MVSSAIKARVDAKLDEGLAKLEKHYKRKFAKPTVGYYTTGSTAGKAWQGRYHVEFHGGLLERADSTEEMIEVTVPHELAHIIAGIVYPEINMRGSMQYTSSGYRRGKREVHGPRWKEVMRVLGADDSRTHSMDTTDFSTPKSKYEYKCIRCSKVYTVGPKIHAQLVESPRSRRCKCTPRGASTTTPCLQLVQDLGRVTYAQVRKARETGAAAEVKVAAKKAPTNAKPIPTGNSKIAKCYQLFAKHRAKYSRADILKIFMSDVGCSQACASTYYATCKSVFESNA